MRRLSFLLVLAFLVLCLSPAQAAKGPLPASVVAIVDVQRILQESLAAKSVQSQIEKHRSKFQTQISKEEAELRDAEQKLTELRKTEQADAYAQAEQKLRGRFLFVERHVQARRKALDQAFTDAMSTVRTGLIDVVKKSAKERGVTLVIVKQQVIWHDQVIDLTDLVLGRLNQKIPEILIKISQEGNDIPSSEK